MGRPATSGHQMTESIDIGAVIAASGLPASTLHVWERRGLIEPSGREGMRRQYEPTVLHRIAMIVTLQRSGFTLSEIGQLLTLDAFADGKGALQQKLDVLIEQRRELDRAIEGIEHALACPALSPLECDGFRRHLDGVLPVKRRRGEA